MWPATPLPSSPCSSPLSTITLHPFHRFTSKYLWYQSPASIIDLVTFTKFKFSKRNIHTDNWYMLYCLSGGSTSKNAPKCAILNGSVIGDRCNLWLFCYFCSMMMIRRWWRCHQRWLMQIVVIDQTCNFVNAAPATNRQYHARCLIVLMIRIDTVQLLWANVLIYWGKGHVWYESNIVICRLDVKSLCREVLIPKEWQSCQPQSEGGIFFIGPRSDHSLP